MDPSSRLDMLFSGEDEGLLRNAAVGLHPAPEKSNVASRTSATQDSTSSAMPKDEESDWDEVFKDEYLASFARAEKEASRKRSSKKKTTSQGGFKGANLPSSSLPTASQDPQMSSKSTGVRYFCPIVAISKFPYKYIHGGDADRIAKRFFDGGKFLNRTWDLYFIHPPADLSPNPLILVPLSLVQNLLEEINQEFQCTLSVPSNPELGVLLPFENDGMPQPQYFGTSTSQEMKAALERNIPARNGDSAPPAECAYEVDRSFAAFKAKVEAAVDATRRKSKAAKGKRQRDQVQKVRDWSHSSKRLQCYLGLRPRLPRNMQQQGDIGKGKSWGEQKQAAQDHALDCGITLLPLDVKQPSQFPAADEPIFVCIDVESNEKNHEQITEIGISTFDTLDLEGVAPGVNGSNWVDRIRSRHFRISEYGHIVNSEYIEGCPDAFEFGESEWISIKQAGAVIDACFNPPYSADINFNQRKSVPVHMQTANQHSSERDTTAGQPSSTVSDTSSSCGGVDVSPKVPSSGKKIQDYKQKPRNIILLGHDIANDVTYMRKLGCNVLNIDAAKNPVRGQPTFLERLDTNILFRVLKRETQPSSLGKILVDLEIMGWNLHNAGNDARYTMEAMIGIALRSRLQDGSSSGKDFAPPSTAPANDRSLDTSLAKVHIHDDGNKEEASTTSAATAGGGDRDDAWKTEVDRRVAVQMEEAANRVREECALWDTVLGGRGDWDIANDDVDGGVAPGISFDEEFGGGGGGGGSRSKGGYNNKPGNGRGRGRA